MDGVGTSVVGRPRRLSADRRARPTYTLIWEEPVSRQGELVAKYAYPFDPGLKYLGLKHALVKFRNGSLGD